MILRLLRTIAPAVALIALAPAFAQDITAPVTSRTGKVIVSGVVIDDDTSKPIPSFGIEFGWPAAPEGDTISWFGRTTRTEARDGHFETSTFRPPGGKTAFRVIANGYTPEMVTSAPIIAPAVIRDLTIRLKHGDTLNGRIVNHDGTPAAGAQVCLLAPSAGIAIKNGAFPDNEALFAGPHAQTNAAGRFSLRGVAERTGVLVVTAPTSSIYAQPLQPEDTEPVIKLPQPGSIRAHCDIPGDNSDQTVWITTVLPGLAAQCEVTTDIRNGGDATILGLSPGRYDVARAKSIYLDGVLSQYFCERRRLAIEPDQSVEVAWTRPEGSQLRGRVLGLKDYGTSYAIVKVRGHEARGSDMLDMDVQLYDVVRTEADGSFVTSRLKPTDYVIVAEAYHPAAADLAGMRAADADAMQDVRISETAPPAEITLRLQPTR